jgi:hypothetical protein
MATRKRSSRVRATGPTLVQASRRVSATFKAEIHNVRGAGRRGVTRPFLGITDDDVRKIQALVDRWNEAKSRMGA